MSDTTPMPGWMRDDLSKMRRRKVINNIKNSKFVQSVKHQFEENPIGVILAVGAVLAASAKLIDAWGHAKGSRAYAKQVDYRINRNK